MDIFFGGNCVTLPMVNLVDEVTIAPPYIHYKRKATEFILYYIYDGEMYLTESTTEYILKQGDIILLDPARSHFGRKASICHYIYIHFSWENFAEKKWISINMPHSKFWKDVKTHPLSPIPCSIPSYTFLNITIFPKKNDGSFAFY